MKTMLTSAFLCFMIISVKCQDLKPHQLDSIYNYLLEFRDAALAKDSARLSQMIYASRDTAIEDYQKTAIDFVIKNDEYSSGDFSFSISALNALMDSLYLKFKPIPDNIREMLLDQPDGVFRTATLNLKNEEVPIFDFKGVHIVLIMSEKKIRLLFWENLNSLRNN